MYKTNRRDHQSGTPMRNVLTEDYNNDHSDDDDDDDMKIKV
jgi:hypothetical protein